MNAVEEALRQERLKDRVDVGIHLESALAEERLHYAPKKSFAEINAEQAVPTRNFVNEVLGDLEKKFRSKNEEYSTAKSRWANFDDGAALQGETPEQTLLGYVSKQVVSLFAAKNHHPERLGDLPFLEEKAGDVAVYMIILLAMAREKAVEQAKEEAAKQPEEPPKGFFSEVPPSVQADFDRMKQLQRDFEFLDKKLRQRG